MAFLIHSIDNANVVPWEYLPTDDITLDIGEALVLSSGLLVAATGTTKPTYISMAKYGTAPTEGTIVPVIKVRDDIVFETTASASTGSAPVGSAVTIASDGLRVTGTTTSGVATIVGKDGTGAGDKVRVRFL